MKLNAVAVASSDMKKTVAFYTVLGFQFPEFNETDPHVEAITAEGSARLMIDTKALLTDILGEAPTHGNHSSFAIEFETPAEVDETAARVKEAGFTLIKEPWDAFWGQRYALVADPDGYMIDLYAAL